MDFGLGGGGGGGRAQTFAQLKSRNVFGSQRKSLGHNYPVPTTYNSFYAMV